MEATVPEVIEFIKEILNEPESLFEMIRSNIQETVLYKCSLDPLCYCLSGVILY